jgi:hypothetical protein
MICIMSWLGLAQGEGSLKGRFLAHGLSGSGRPSAERGTSAPQCAPLDQKAWMRGPAKLSARGFPITLRFELMASMATKSLTVSSKDQLTQGKQLLPGGRLELQVERATAEISGFIGLLAGRTSQTASLEELTEAAAAGWAAQ